MRLEIGNVRAEARVLETNLWLPEELKRALDAARPTVSNSWSCKDQEFAPNPPKQMVDAPVNIGFHGEKLNHLAEHRRFLTGEISKEAFEQRTQKDIAQSSRELSDWFARKCGFPGVGALDAALQGPFGRKADLSFDLALILKDYKDRYSLQIESGADYVFVELKLPGMSAFNVAKVVLAVPRGLKHRLLVRGECRGDRYIPAETVSFSPQWFEETEMRPASGDLERRVRKARNKMEQDWERDRLRRLAEEKRMIEDRMKELREELKGLNEGG